MIIDCPKCKNGRERLQCDRCKAFGRLDTVKEVSDVIAKEHGLNLEDYFRMRLRDMGLLKK